MMTQGASSVPEACNRLQSTLDTMTQRASYLNIHFAPHKYELMHMIPTTSKLNPNTTANRVTLYRSAITPGKSFQSLGTIIDQRASFRHHIAKACSTARNTAGMVVRISKLKGISLFTIHHLIVTTVLPGLCRGFEAWWTGAEHIARQLGPTYYAMA